MRKLLTNWSNNEPNNTIQLRNFHENQITKEIGMSDLVGRTSESIYLTIQLIHLNFTTEFVGDIAVIAG
jgi:hypothetical protein